MYHTPAISPTHQQKQPHAEPHGAVRVDDIGRRSSSKIGGKCSLSRERCISAQCLLSFLNWQHWWHHGVRCRTPNESEDCPQLEGSGQRNALRKYLFQMTASGCTVRQKLLIELSLRDAFHVENHQQRNRQLCQLRTT